MESSNGGTMKVVNKTTVRGSDLGLRVLALALTLVAAIMVGLDKQTKVVPITVVSTLPPLNVPVTALWHDMSAFVYFMVTNAIACAYAALSLVLTLVATKSGKKGLTMMIMVLDLLMVALLFSGIGAAGAVGVIGYQGNSHVQWNKVCNVVEKFCHQLSAALVVSLLGSVAYMLLIGLAALNLHKKYK